MIVACACTPTHGPKRQERRRRANASSLFKKQGRESRRARTHLQSCKHSTHLYSNVAEHDQVAKSMMKENHTSHAVTLRTEVGLCLYMSYAPTVPGRLSRLYSV